MNFRIMDVRQRAAPTAVLAIAAVVGFWASGIQARTWYVKVDGTGDAPTIQAGVDSAAVGDVVFVGAGTYQIDSHVNVKAGITLMSVSGPYQTKIIPVPSTNPLCAFFCYDLVGGTLTEIIGFWIEDFLVYPGWGGPAYGIILSFCGSMNVSNNVVTGNGVGIFANIGGTVSLQNNTIIGNGRGVDREDAISLSWLYNIIWDRTEGGVDGFFNDLLNLSDNPVLNFSQDPQFCGATAGNFYLQSDSPCAPGNSPWPQVGLVGALPVGCGTVKTESRTWGAIKDLYQN